AAAGTTAAGDPAPAPEPDASAQREFRLRDGESVADGIRGAARGQLAAAEDNFAAVSKVGLGAAVHDTRKRIKRVRAALRLSRGAISDDVYRRENAGLRAIANRLSPPRDAHVLIQTLDDLQERCAEELPPGGGAALRARLVEERERALVAIDRGGTIVGETAQALAEARARTEQWAFERDGFEALEPGLRRIYRRGRKRLRAAREEPTAENLHDCRKRVKDLWHAAQLLHPAHPERMERLARDAHELADLIGDHHDLSVLRDYVEEHPELFEDHESRDALLAALDRRRDGLARRALKRGRRLYDRSPKRFVASVKRGWRKRVAAAAERG
ncbi:MAG TPA: CHAD domain-containing protein, partial [Solirubrobacteraceae bacterium]|nr:CHAD domain-containing protein [Solirubrobacteraceae bacterium]